MRLLIDSNSVLYHDHDHLPRLRASQTHVIRASKVSISLRRGWMSPLDPSSVCLPMITLTLVSLKLI